MKKILSFLMMALLSVSLFAADVTVKSTFTKATVPADNKVTDLDGKVTWSIATTVGAGSPTYAVGKSTIECLKFGGSKTEYFSKVEFSTDYFKDYNVTSVALYVKNNGSKVGTLTAKQGDVTIGTKANEAATSDWNVMTATGTKGAGGTLVVTYEVEQASYISYIEVTYEGNGETPDPVVANYCKTEVGHLMEATPAQDSYVLLSIGSKNGKTIVRIDQDEAKNTQMFDYLQVTGLTQTGEDVAEGGAKAMAVEFDTPTPVNDSLTLEILWSTVNWAGRWMVQNLRVAVADCEYAVLVPVPVTPITCAEVYSKAKDDKVALNDVTVTYVNGKNVYVKDESGSMLLYLPAAATWKAGDKLAGVEGVVDVYNGLYEVKPSADQVAAVTATAGEAPAPVELAVAPVAADVNKYVILKNVSVATGEFTTASATNLDLTIGEAKVVLRNNFKIAQTFDADKLYNIVATVAIYTKNDQTTIQLYFISAEEQVDPRMKGAYKVGGETPDFASLYDACAALETNGMKGDVQLIISGDLAENKNVGITNNTNYTLSIVPDGATKRTIQYGEQDDNAGPSGHIIIGEKMGLGWSDAVATKNVVIDGSFEGEGQYLEFRGGKVGGVVIVLYGGLTNTVVKNCRIINPRTSGTTYAVHFRSEKNADNAPQGVGLENCYLEVTGVANAQVVYFNGSQSATAAGKPKDCYLRGCEIVSNLRGVFFNGATNAVFEGNTFRFPAASGGFLAHGIMGNAQSGEIIVRNNKFIELKSTNTSAGDFGMCGITASGGSNVWVIENNYFAGLDATGAVAGTAITLRYVRCGDSCVVRHNTFYVPALTNKPATDLVVASPICALYLAGAKAYPVENNIFVSEEAEANNSLIRGAVNENVKNNVFFHKGGNAAILAGAVVAKTWDEFTAEGANAGSKWAEPKFADAAKGDLAIAEKNEDLKVARLETVLKDIDGKDRAEQTYAGAFEYIEPETPEGVDNIESIEGAQKIFRNGEVLIIRDGKTYNMMGQTIR